MLNRKACLETLIKHGKDQRIKAVTGLKRVGKTYLLKRAFKNYLLKNGMEPNHFIYVSLEDEETLLSLSSGELIKNLKAKVLGHKRYYLILSGIQNERLLSDSIKKMANERNWILHITKKLKTIPNLSIYVIISNKKLFNELFDAFGNNLKEIKLNPISFKEHTKETNPNEVDVALNNYIQYGGMPITLNLSKKEYKEQYLKNLISLTYCNDIKEREKIRNERYLDILLRVLANNIGKPLNQNKIADIFFMEYGEKVSKDTVSQYLNYLEDSYLIEKTSKIDIKRDKEIRGSYKYYFKDNGILNAMRNFKAKDQTPLIENAIYNELSRKGYKINWGNIETYQNDESGKTQRLNEGINFIAKKRKECYSIQFIYGNNAKEKMQKAIKPLLKLPNYFEKLIIEENPPAKKVDSNGIIHLRLDEFLLTNFCV